ncbi:unnamed protein product, partial [Ilex paraguariensis]
CSMSDPDELMRVSRVARAELVPYSLLVSPSTFTGLRLVLALLSSWMLTHALFLLFLMWTPLPLNRMRMLLLLQGTTKGADHQHNH